jgi:NTE family protein
MDLVFAVNVAGELGPEPPRSVFDILYRSSEIMMRRLDGIQIRQAALVISPEVGGVGTLQFYRAEECIARGEAAARAALPQIRQLIGELQVDGACAAGERA